MSSFPLATFDRVLDAVLKSATHRHSTLHGESHWRAVAFTALELAPQVPRSDPLIGLLFGLLHDSQRLNDGGDPQHARAPASSRDPSSIKASSRYPPIESICWSMRFIITRPSKPPTIPPSAYAGTPTA
jgi:hypothetical protein